MYHIAPANKMERVNVSSGVIKQEFRIPKRCAVNWHEGCWPSRRLCERHRIAASGCCRLPKCDGVQSGIGEPTFQKKPAACIVGGEAISSIDYKHPDHTSFRTVWNVDTLLPDCTAPATSETDSVWPAGKLRTFRTSVTAASRLHSQHKTLANLISGQQWPSLPHRAKFKIHRAN